MPNSAHTMVLLKYTVIITNVLCALLGLLLVVTALELTETQNEFEVFLQTNRLDPSIFLMVIGACLIVASICGCVGASTKSILIVYMYGSLLVFVVFFQNTTIYYVFIKRWDILDDIKQTMTGKLANYTNHSDAKIAWDKIQQKLHCCGVTYPSDWAPLNVKGCLIEENGFDFTVPFSCSKNNFMSCRNTYKNGCLGILENVFFDLYPLLACGLVLLSIMQIAGIIATYLLVKTLNAYEVLSSSIRRT